MTFQDHLRNLAAEALSSIPAGEAEDIYVISFFIDNERDDPLQPTLIIGYNTEAQFQCTIADASDEAEARWNYAFWLQNELTVIGDLTRDLDGAAARHQWISELGLWYDEPTHPEDWMTTVGPTAALIEAKLQPGMRPSRSRPPQRWRHQERHRQASARDPPRAGVLRGDRAPDRGSQPARTRRRVHGVGPHRLRHLRRRHQPPIKHWTIAQTRLDSKEAG
ncbi:hypothetical protein AB0C89_34280 [Streptomyces sp. NPDC048491]|uniref:hypothetical protein n=1 Tax=Streptomyces sp. NPDC048491 TaxID=3157207 RepID=UPI003440DABC